MTDDRPARPAISSEKFNTLMQNDADMTFWFEGRKRAWEIPEELYDEAVTMPSSRDRFDMKQATQR